MFRLRIHIHTRARHIPWDDVLRPGRSLLYSLLYQHDPRLAGRVHRSSGMAPFGYSAPTFPGAARIRGVYAAGGDGWWDVGTTSRDIAAAWVAGLVTNPLLNWGGVAIKVVGVFVTTPPVWDGGAVVWRTTTPVCVRTTTAQGSKPLLPGDGSYLPALRASLRTRARSVGVPLVAAPQLHVLHVGGRRSYPVSGSDTPRVGCPLAVRIAAPPQLLSVLWCTGIGQQTGAGFGWVGG